MEAASKTDDPRYMQGLSEMGASGRLEHWDRFADLSHFIPNGCHLSLYDDRDRYFSGLLAFLRAEE